VSGVPGTKTVGDIAELAVMAAFLKLGFRVAIPWSDDCRYDLIVDTGEQLLRVQVKAASECRDGTVLRFHAYSPRYAAGKFQGREDYRGQADVFAAYAASNQQVYVLPVDAVPETDVWLRLAPAMHGNRYGSRPATEHSNGNHHGIRWAKDHTLEAWAARQAASPVT
jgi:hypothetical protein